MSELPITSTDHESNASPESDPASTKSEILDIQHLKPPHPLPVHLQPDREIHIIISILSGGHGAQAFYDHNLRPLLEAHRVEYTTHTTKSALSIVELTRDVILFNARRGVKQTLILLSGDGGVVDLVNTLSTFLIGDDYRDIRTGSGVFMKPVVCLMPQGTANALAWSAGCAADPLRTMMQGRAKKVPEFEARFSSGARLVGDEGRARQPVGDGIIVSSEETASSDRPTMYGAVVFSWGLHASLVAMSDTVEYRKHGIDRFKMAAQKLLEESHAYRGLVKIKKADTNSDSWEVLGHAHPQGDDGSQDRKEGHAYILATLVSNLEQHFCISPATRSLDGSFRLVAIGTSVSSQDIMRILGLTYQGGKHIEDPTVEYVEIKALRIEFDEPDEQWRMICVDGKIVAVEESGWVELRRLKERSVVELVC